MPAASTSARAASYRSSCKAVNGLSGSSATAQWVQTDSSTSAGCAATALARPTTSAGAAPTRCIPVSTLRCTGTGGRDASEAVRARRSTMSAV
jgi:hypothetical protein